MTISNSEKETQEIARQIAKKIKNGGIILLYGELGSGKTTFTKGLAKGLGIKEFSIKSPTYTYIRKYQTEAGDLYHLDLYRINGQDELLEEEIQELMSNQGNIVIIEWANKLKFPLPEKTIRIKFEYLDEKSRKIEYQKSI